MVIGGSESSECDEVLEMGMSAGVEGVEDCEGSEDDETFGFVEPSDIDGESDVVAGKLDPCDIAI